MNDSGPSEGGRALGHDGSAPSHRAGRAPQQRQPSEEPDHFDPPRRSGRLEDKGEALAAQNKEASSRAPTTKARRRCSRRKVSTRPNASSGNSDDEVVVLNYSEISSQSPEELQRLQEEVVRVEEYEVRAP